VNLLEQISEDEMIATFLSAELGSSRFAEKLSGLLGGRALVTLDAAERRALLDEHRSYGRREGLFLGFPPEVDWFRAEVDREEVLDVLFIDWDWWLTISDGTRRPRDAVRRIRAGEVPGSNVEEHEPYARQPQPPLIAVTTPAHAPIVLLEGHVRLTAYALFPHLVPDELEILLGVSDEMPNWALF
jgi:hypothetical protein